MSIYIYVYGFIYLFKD